jgi:4-amino-4-deoxy-L-arabinose transferase-like glycosyltransferase
MAWRQFDTEFYAYDFYRNGINLFKPSVCWLGAHKTLILEFPLISGIISLFYSAFGHNIFYARLVIFLFYIGSAFYLYLLIKYLYYDRIAKLTILIYLMVPLSLYYSRAINIDFPAIFFSIAMLYYLLLGYDKLNYKYIILGTGFGIIAFLIKSPYAFYVFIPLLYYVFKNKKSMTFLKTLPLISLPVLVFLLWQNHTVKINTSAPDWFFIPGYFKFTDMSEWYFGNIEQRLNIENWKTIFYRFVESGTTFIGFPVFIYGIFVKAKTSKNFFYFYLLGLLVYLLIFFNLNLIHDYYQIPLLIAGSFFMALSLDTIYSRLKEKSHVKAGAALCILIILLMINSI